MQVGEWASSVLEREEVVREEKRRKEKRRKGKEGILSFMLPCHGERERGKEGVKIAKIPHSVLSRTIVNEAARASPVQPIINMGQGFL